MIDLLLSDGSQAPVGTGYALPERVCSGRQGPGRTASSTPTAAGAGLGEATVSEWARCKPFPEENTSD